MNAWVFTVHRATCLKINRCIIKNYNFFFVSLSLSRIRALGIITGICAFSRSTFAVLRRISLDGLRNLSWIWLRYETFELSNLFHFRNFRLGTRFISEMWTMKNKTGSELAACMHFFVAAVACILFIFTISFVIFFCSSKDSTHRDEPRIQYAICTVCAWLEETELNFKLVERSIWNEFLVGKLLPFFGETIGRIEKESSIHLFAIWYVLLTFLMLRRSFNWNLFALATW